jgi:hypothetical protein
VFVSFIEGTDRGQVSLLPACVDDYVGPDALVRVVDAFVASLDLTELGFSRTVAAATGRPGYHSGDMLRLYIWGYLNQIRSSRHLERACVRDLDALWLLRQLAPSPTVPWDCLLPRSIVEIEAPAQRSRDRLSYYHSQLSGLRRSVCTALTVAPVSLRIRSAAASSAGQAITRSGTITVPFVSGDTSKAQAKLSAPKHVPIIIGMAKPKS